MLVVDASVATMWFLQQAHSDAARALVAPAYELVAPDLLHLEVGNAIVRAVRRGMIRESSGDSAIRTHLPRAVRLMRMDGRGYDAFELAWRFGGSVYDAAYLLLAAALNVPVITHDAQMLKTAAAASIKAHAIADGPPRIEFSEDRDRR
jgi:predicted nucleic acid-binding protein